MNDARNVALTALVYGVGSWLNGSYDPMSWSGLSIIIGFFIVAGIWSNNEDDVTADEAMALAVLAEQDYQDIVGSIKDRDNEILQLKHEISGWKQGSKAEADAADEARAEVRALRLELKEVMPVREVIQSDILRALQVVAPYKMLTNIEAFDLADNINKSIRK